MNLLSKALRLVKSASISIFVRISRLLKDTFKVSFEGYSVFLPTSDQAAIKIYTDYLASGEWGHEPYVRYLVSRIINEHIPTAVFIDGGASYGMYTLLACKQPGVKKIVAIEASPSTYKYLEKTIKQNELDKQVISHNLAIFSSSGERVYFTPHESYSEWDSVRRDLDVGNKSQVGITTISLDDIVFTQLEPVPSSLFIKLDLEGGEPEAFSGMTHIFNSDIDYVMLVEFHTGVLNKLQQGGAQIFASKIWEKTNIVYVIKGGERRYERIKSLDDFKGRAKWLSKQKFPNNMRNLLLCKRPLDLAGRNRRS